MRVAHLIEEWKAEQNRRRELVRIEALSPLPRFIAGADGAFSRDKTRIFVVALVYDRIEKQVVEIARCEGQVTSPYVPGYLSFREGPTVVAAIKKLRHPFGVLCIDGQGMAHPRRCGLACHVGVELDVPTIGVAKSVLVGDYDEPALARGREKPLIHKDEIIGLALRTKANVRPVFISVGHRVDLLTAKQLVVACGGGYRIPEPTRQADIEVARFKAG